MEKIFTDRISTKVFIILIGIGLISILPTFLLLPSKDYSYIFYLVIFVLSLTGLLGLLKVKFQFLETSLNIVFRHL